MASDSSLSGPSLPCACQVCTAVPSITQTNCINLEVQLAPLWLLPCELTSLLSIGPLSWRVAGEATVQSSGQNKLRLRFHFSVHLCLARVAHWTGPLFLIQFLLPAMHTWWEPSYTRQAGALTSGWWAKEGSRCMTLLSDTSTIGPEAFQDEMPGTWDSIKLYSLRPHPHPVCVWLVWRSKDNLREADLSFLHMVPGDSTLIFRLGNKCLWPLSHLASP